jgi:hypothetical protein
VGIFLIVFIGRKLKKKNKKNLVEADQQCGYLSTKTIIVKEEYYP